MMRPSSELVPGGSAQAVLRRACDLITVLVLEEGGTAALADVLRAHGERDPLELTVEDVAQMRAAAGALREVFAAEDVDQAAQLVNDLLATSAYPPRLSTHGGVFGWHLHVDSRDDARWGEWLVTSSCLGLAVALAERQAPPGGICAAPGCERPFVHTGGGTSRQYCGTRCATRQRVAAHRRSKRSARERDARSER